jgi:hypothetical protein
MAFFFENFLEGLIFFLFMNYNIARKILSSRGLYNCCFTVFIETTPIENLFIT